MKNTNGSAPNEFPRSGATTIGAGNTKNGWRSETLARLQNFRFACTGTYVPRRCGIATFTRDLCQSIAEELSDPQSCQILALNDAPEGYRYPGTVRFEIRQEQPLDYRLAAAFINRQRVDLLLVQHEYGIFGGREGRHLLAMLQNATMPVVTTMHTVLPDPAPELRETTQRILDLSDRIVVMAHRAVQIIADTYEIDPKRVTVIPHGIPDMPFVDPASFKDKFGVGGRTVLLTFGFLSPAKGIEYAIRALPELVEDFPDLVYIVLGATHPHLKRDRGEEYRHELQRLAEELGVSRHVLLQDRYVDLAELCEFLGAADIYLTPYLGEEQIVSGTLAYAMGAGKAVVSTSYSHAREVLAEGRGRIVPFRDPEALSREIRWLLENEVERQATCMRAYLATRGSVWNQVARSYLDVFQSACAHPAVQRGRPLKKPASASARSPIPELSGQSMERG